MKIVVLDGATAIGTELSFDAFQALGDVSYYPNTTPDQIAARAGDAEAVLVNKVVFDQKALDACPKLRYIGLTSTGFNVVDLDECRKRGIEVCNVPAYSSSAVAQQIFAYLLEIYNKVSRHDARVKQGDWQNCDQFCFYEPQMHETMGKTIGIVGFGGIGKRVASLAHAFEMKVLVHTRTVRESDREAYPFVTFCTLEELLAKSDVVTLHCPLNASSEGMMNENAFRQMKDGAIFFNASRGPLVVEQALADALNSGKLSAAAVDVASIEPIRADNPLLTAKNILITPHSAWAPVETRARLLEIVYQNLEAFQNGHPQNSVL